MELLRNDLAFALRGCRRQPGFTLVAVLTLALGIGATTAIFSVVDTVLLRPLPYPSPERLMAVETVDGDSGAVYPTFSYPTFADLRARAGAFDVLAAWHTRSFGLTDAVGEPRQVTGGAVSAALLPMLGVEPLHGRGIQPADDRRGAPPVALLGYRLWQRRFGGTPSVLGRAIELEGVTHTVVGVLPNAPERLAILDQADVVVPLEPQEGTEHRGLHNLRALGRLAPGAGPAAATAEASAIIAALAQEHPRAIPDTLGARLEPYAAVVVARVRGQLWLLLGAVACVLAIACVNVSHLLLGRAAARAGEVAVRRALGAGRGRLARQFLVESVVLTVSAGALGALLAVGGVRLLLARVPESLPRRAEIAVDPRVLGFTLAVSLAIGVLFSLAPLLETARADLVRVLRHGTRAGAQRAQQRLRRGLVVVEVALAVVLVVGAGLLAQTLWRLGRADPGFAQRDALALEVALPTPFVTPAWRHNVRRFEAMRERLEAVPGVVEVTAALQPPYAPGWGTSFTVDGRPAPRPGSAPSANYRPVLPGYFRAAGIPLLRGRALERGDDADAAGAVVVNQAFVRRYFADQEPLGARIDPGAWWGDNPSPFTIVGVVGDVLFAGADRPAQPAMYFPHAQQPSNELTFLVRLEGDPLARADDLRQAIWAGDPELPLAAATTVAAELAAGRAPRRLLLELLGAFAAVALFLAALGIYGLLAYGVAQRRREIGVRMALGARPAAVVGRVLAQGLGLTAAGLALGLAASAGVTRFLSAMLYGVDAVDPATFAAGALFLLAAAAAASLLPARRATRVAPADVLRHE